MKLLFVSGLLILSLSACTQKVEMSESMKKATVDSLVRIRMKDLREQAREDLDQRMTIELRAKTDSVLQARKKPADTLAKPAAE